jgi:hypothetical protein
MGHPCRFRQALHHPGTRLEIPTGLEGTTGRRKDARGHPRDHEHPSISGIASRTWTENDAAVDAAWMTVAVYDVRDDLYVTG